MVSRSATFSLLLLWTTQIPAQVVAFRNVNVIPMTHETVLHDQTVIIRGDRIDTIGPSSDVKIPRRATKIDGQGKFLMPGLCDLHIHLFGGREGNPIVLKLYAANGVTTVLNMRGMRGALELREQIAAGEVFGPTLYTTSPILGNTSPNPKTRAKGIEAVEKFVQQGYDFIKVYNLIPKEGYEGIIEAADRLGVPVVGHAVRSVGIEGAIQSGQHIAHMEEVIYGYFKDDLDEAKIEPLARRFKEAGISIIATLTAYHNIIRQVEDIDEILASPGIEFVPERITKPWQPDRNRYLARFDLQTIERRLGPEFAFQQNIVRIFTEVGVPVLVGTDATIPIVIPGYSTHQELREFVDAGLSPYQALAAGTSKAAKFLGDAEKFGTIEEGKRADLILLNANPLDDIGHTEDIAGVMLRGEWFDNSAISQMLEEIRVHQDPG